VAAVIREYTESLVYDYLKNFNTIVDIGGNPIRHYEAKRTNVHSLCPTLCAKDALRNANRRASRDSGKQLRYCQCQLFDVLAHNCNHVDSRWHAGDGSIDAFMAQDVIYYLSPNEIVAALQMARSHSLYSAHHVHETPTGTSAGGQYRWHSEEGGVVAVVTGQESEPYQHFDMAWFDGKTQYTSPEGVTMVWSRELLVDDVSIVGFTIVDKPFLNAPVPASTLISFHDALASNKLGEIDIRGIMSHTKDHASALVTVLSPVRRVVSCSGITVWHYADTKRVTVPKDYLAALRINLAHRPRDKDSWVSFVNFAKGRMTQFNITPTAMADIVTHTLPYVFVMDMDDEVAALRGAADFPAVSGNLHNTLQKTWTSSISLDSLWGLLPTIRRLLLNRWFQTAALAVVLATAGRITRSSVFRSLLRFIAAMIKARTVGTLAVTTVNPLAVITPRQLGSMVLYVVYEELFKRRTPSALLPFIEAATHITGRIPSVVPPLDVFSTYNAHDIWTRVPLAAGMFLHLNWNLMVIKAHPVPLLGHLVNGSAVAANSCYDIWHLFRAPVPLAQRLRKLGRDAFVQLLPWAFHTLYLNSDELDRQVYRGAALSLTGLLSAAPQLVHALLGLDMSWVKPKAGCIATSVPLVTMGLAAGLYAASYLIEPKESPAPVESRIHPEKMCLELVRAIGTDKTFKLADVCVERPFKPLAEDAKVVLSPEYGLICTPKIGAVKCGPTLLHLEPFHYRSCSHNEHVALCNRVLKVPPVIDANAFYAYRQWVHFYFDDLFEPVVAVTDDVWLSRYPPHKRAMYSAALAEIASGNVSSRFAENAAFVKRENNLKIDADGEPVHGDPRLIQAKDAQYQATVGPFLQAFSEMVKAKWNVDHVLTYSAGMTAEEVGGWMAVTIAQFTMFCLPLATDKARFDSCYRALLQRLEHEIYKRCGAQEPVLFAVGTELSMKGRTKCGTRYSKEDGNRPSGTYATSVGNTTFNVPTTFYHLSGHARPYAGARVRVMGLGDDAVAAKDGCNSDAERAAAVQLVVKGDASLGFDAEAERPLTIHEMTYCSGRFWPTSTGYVLGPKVGRTLAKLFWHVDDLPAEAAPIWARSVALGCQRDYAHIPVLRVLIRRVLELTAHLEAHPIREAHRTHAAEEHQAVDATFDFFEAIYGVSKDEVRSLEAHIARATLVSKLDHPLLQRLIAADL
jgi:hypothetical protein